MSNQRDDDGVPLCRRQVVVGGLVALGGLALSGCNTGLPSGPVDVGTLQDFAVGSWTLDRSGALIIGRDAAGLFAYSAICTHAGCVVEAPDASGRSICQCHGSLFDGNGGVVRGPARSDLPHFQVSISGETVMVDPGQRVSASERTAV